MRFGIAVRLFGVLVLGSVLALQGATFKNRTPDTELGHVTVMLKSGSDAQLISQTQADAYDFKVESVATDSKVNGYVASMETSDIDKLRSDENVAFVVMDKVTTVEHTWWDDALNTLRLRTPHFN